MNPTPHSIEAEEAIICACLNDPQAQPIAMGAVKAEEFYTSKCRLTFEAITRISRRGETVDLVSVVSDMGRAKTLEQVGGPAAISAIVEGIGSHRTIKGHCRIVRELHRSRAAIQEARLLIERLAGGERFGDVAGAHLSAISQLATVGRSKPRTMAEITPVVMQHLREVSEHGKPFGLSTGFADLDRRLCGFAKKDLIVVAARPSMGKTVLGMQFGMHAAQNGNKVLFYSLEMGSEQIVTRAMSAQAQVSGDVMRKGYLNASTWPRLERAQQELDQLPFVLVDTPALSISEMQAIARVEHAKSPLGMIVADYLQLSRAELSGKNANREREIALISSGLKSLAKELDVPVIALSQLNRSLENRTDKRPQLADLRESGAIEQDADVVMFIYRDEVYNRGDDNPNKGIAEIITAKQRNGPTGTDRLRFSGETSTFYDLYREESGKGARAAREGQTF